jgi:hypothetical protein
MNINSHYDGPATGFYDKQVFSGYLTKPGRSFHMEKNDRGWLVFDHVTGSGEVNYIPTGENVHIGIVCESSNPTDDSVKREVEELGGILVRGVQAYSRQVCKVKRLEFEFKENPDDRMLEERSRRAKRNLDIGNF